MRPTELPGIGPLPHPVEDCGDVISAALAESDEGRKGLPAEQPSKPGAWDRYWASLDADMQEKLAPNVQCLRSWFAIAEVWAQPSAALPEGAEPPTCPSCGSSRKDYRKCTIFSGVHNAQSLLADAHECRMCGDKWHGNPSKGHQD